MKYGRDRQTRECLTDFKTFWGQSSLNHWDDPKCNMINGTQGLAFGPYLKKEDKPLYVFSENWVDPCISPTKRCHTTGLSPPGAIECHRSSSPVLRRIRTTNVFAPLLMIKNGVMVCMT